MLAILAVLGITVVIRHGWVVRCGAHLERLLEGNDEFVGTAVLTNNVGSIQ